MVAYRYWVHPYVDPKEPLKEGRRLSVLTETEAIAEAERLLESSAYPRALGFMIVDTEEGEVIWRRARV